MIKPEDLTLGQFYFLLLFYHPKIEIPMIKTYIYVGKNLDADSGKSSEDEWYFQDPKSYLEHGSFVQLSKKIKHETFLANKDTLFQMCDINGLIKNLIKIREGASQNSIFWSLAVFSLPFFSIQFNPAT